LPGAKRSAAGKDEFFLRLGPRMSERQKLLECFLVDHVGNLER
jgi:hypothetical protein